MFSGSNRSLSSSSRYACEQNKKKKALNFGKMSPHNNILLLHCKLVLLFYCPICEHVLEWSLLFSVYQPVSKDLHHRYCCSTLSVWGKRGYGKYKILSLSLPLSLSLSLSLSPSHLWRLVFSVASAWLMCTSPSSSMRLLLMLSWLRGVLTRSKTDKCLAPSLDNLLLQ